MPWTVKQCDPQQPFPPVVLLSPKLQYSCQGILQESCFLVVNHTRKLFCILLSSIFMGI